MWIVARGCIRNINDIYMCALVIFDFQFLKNYIENF